MYFQMKDANSKSCPMAKMAAWGNCRGDNCAAWRWKNGDNYSFHIKWCEVTHTHVEPARPEGILVWEFIPFDGETAAHWREPREEAMKRREGYCGMAGKP